MTIYVSLNSYSITVSDGKIDTSLDEALGLFLGALMALGYSPETIAQIKKDLELQ